MSFSAFQLTRKEVGYDDFMSSNIAKEGGVDETWWTVNHKPKSFFVYENHCWIACFRSCSSIYYHTHIEKEARSCFSLRELEKWLFEFFTEEGCGF
jgi:hypothetical protein